MNFFYNQNCWLNMVEIVQLEKIKSILKNNDVISVIEEGFIAYSDNRVIVPPVGEMLFNKTNGECHIKYGYIKDDNYYVIKIASGFYDNPKLYGLPSFNGLNLVFDQRNGELKAILLDEGYLTNIRTAAAGAVVAKYLAPKQVKKIGILGTGAQGKLQVEYLKSITSCKKIVVWGLSQEEVNEYKKNLEKKGYSVETTLNLEDIPTACNLIVTCTPSKKPLLKKEWIKPGTHITAMGSDTAEKQELDSEILANADIVVVDSISQSKSRGEVYKAITSGIISEDIVIELGKMISNKQYHRQNDQQITIADLTGVAVQDIQISKIICENMD